MPIDFTNEKRLCDEATQAAKRGWTLGEGTAYLNTFHPARVRALLDAVEKADEYVRLNDTGFSGLGLLRRALAAVERARKGGPDVADT